MMNGTPFMPIAVAALIILSTQSWHSVDLKNSEACIRDETMS